MTANFTLSSVPTFTLLGLVSAHMAGRFLGFEGVRINWHYAASAGRRSPNDGFASPSLTD
jgi:hypothetical protein